MNGDAASTSELHHEPGRPGGNHQDNWFIETMMPGFIERTWCATEKSTYGSLWLKKERLGAYLATSEVPKLLIHAEPGVLVQDVAPPGSKQTMLEIVADYPNPTTENIGAGLHFVQEDNPQESQPLLELVQETFGFAPHLYGVLCEAPVSLQAYRKLYALLNESSSGQTEQLR